MGLMNYEFREVLGTTLGVTGVLLIIIAPVVWKITPTPWVWAIVLVAAILLSIGLTLLQDKKKKREEDDGFDPAGGAIYVRPRTDDSSSHSDSGDGD